MKRILIAGFCLLITSCMAIPMMQEDGNEATQQTNAFALPNQDEEAPTPFLPSLPTLPAPTPEELQLPESTPYQLTIWFHPSLASNLPPFLNTTQNKDAALLSFDLAAEGEAVFAERTYVLAAPFPTITDGVSYADLRELWSEGGSSLVLTEGTAALLRDAWGNGGDNARIAAPGELVDAVWNLERFTILPFHQLDPKLKVLKIDEISPFQKDFSSSNDPLTFRFTLRGDTGIVEAVTALFGPQSPAPLTAPMNRDPDKLTTVALTGVTALVRATAFTMEQRGLTYPARDIGDWLRSADILHISNEVPFAENCPPPNPFQTGVTFCSDQKYIQLLEDIGTDVVELTGDHFHDYGSSAMLFTLGMYKERGWPYYGGGENYAEGKQAVLMEHNGNRIAFIGCNGKGPVFARATDSSPGSVECDMNWVAREIERLTNEGYLVIGTFQHHEYYTYSVPAPMLPDFRTMADAGAVIVSGSQAHHPHGFEFRNGALIHYGLGNLFFDQLGINQGTEQAFIDQHIFYDGRYLGVELLTIRFEDFARSRPMTSAERESLLISVFRASGW